MIRPVIFALTLLLTGSAVTAVSEKPAARSFPVGAAERIYYSGAGTVHIRQGEARTLKISAASAILDEVVVENYDDVLFIEVPDTVEEAVAVVVTLPSVREIVTTGINSVVGSGLASKDLSLEAKGAGSFNFSALKA